MPTYRLKIDAGVVSRPWNLEKDLDVEQRAVVQAPAGPLLVVAGAGTGKTRALTYRVARFIREGVAPERIMLCTFTNRAAREMTRRVESLTGASLHEMWAGTFHHVANRLLREFGEEVGLSPGYSIVDRQDTKEIISKCLADMGGRKKKKRFPRPNVLQSIFSLAANLQMSVAGVVESRYFRFREQKADIMELAERYSRLKGELNVVDFDDLLLGWLALMTRTEKAGRMIAERFLHVLVDEYQDVNTLQARIVDQVATKGHASLTVVGDDAQSIYSFRGASVDLMLDFDTRYPQARILRLQTNYRSTPEILGLANRSITFNRNRLEKTLKASRQGGVTPVCVALGSTLEQACFVAQRILELHHDEGFELNKIGVLYRAHAHSMELQVELGRRQIPFAVRSGLRFFEQAHIKDGLAFLRILQNPADELALGRVFHVHSGVGRATEKKVLAALKRNVAPPAPMPTMAAQIRRLLENEALGARVDGSLRELAAGLERLQQEIDRGGVKAGLSWFGDQLYADYAARHFNNAEIRLEDLAQLAEYGRRFDRVEPFLSEIALAGGMAAQGLKPGQVPSGDHLTLSTVHQAKGLEWQVVFVIWLCDGMFPSVLALKDLGGEEEERRLFHVAATRAKDQLYLCRPLCSDRTAGFRKILRPSRFLTELQPAPPFETWEIELDIEDAD